MGGACLDPHHFDPLRVDLGPMGPRPERENRRTQGVSAAAALGIERFEQGSLARPRLPFSKLSLHAKERRRTLKYSLQVCTSTHPIDSLLGPGPVGESRRLTALTGVPLQGQCPGQLRALYSPVPLNVSPPQFEQRHGRNERQACSKESSIFTSGRKGAIREAKVNRDQYKTNCAEPRSHERYVLLRKVTGACLIYLSSKFNVCRLARMPFCVIKGHGVLARGLRSCVGRVQKPGQESVNSI